MSKVFGYSKRGNDGKGWFKSDAYADREIESIKDPEGGSEVSMPTAIPSPFARIDLVKTAFKNITKTDFLTFEKEKASRNDEKLVSECLDLAEIIFNIDSLKHEIEILTWDTQKELTALKNSTNDKHRRFAETLELYLDQDKDAYNFDLLQTLYLIRYDHQVIGCTSPVTLFFSTGNDLSDAQVKITGNHITFGNKPLPLYDRDIEFQKYLYLLFETHPLLKKRMRDFNGYLNRNRELLKSKNRQFYDELNNLLKDAEKENKYSVLYDRLDSEYAVDVLSVPLFTRKNEDLQKILQGSDFVIRSSKSPYELEPLVLQNEFRKQWRYANDVWDRNNQVPYKVEENINGETVAVDINDRKPPGLAVQYPYLTVSDFLEPYLIRLVYPVNKDKFFDGNLQIEFGDDTKGYILPLKREFFNYFNSSDLTRSGAGKPRIKLTQTNENAVKVVLDIPVAKEGEYITFERLYYESKASQTAKPDEKRNKGVIVEHQVGLTLFPFLKLNNSDITPFYRIQLIDRDAYGEFKDNRYSLTFYSDRLDKPVEIRSGEPIARREKNENGDATTKYFSLENDFDFIQINSGFATGIILPMWKEYYPGQDEFSFAVDFGTTNTHIEYKIGRTGEPKPFNISSANPQIATLFDPKKTDSIKAINAFALTELIDHEFVPFVIGQSSSGEDNHNNFRFPQRTVLSESHSLDVQKQTFSLADFNIPFTYEKKRDTSKIQTNLKWAKKNDENAKRVRAFFEEIMMLLRNKVLLEGGNLSKTNLIWFFPSSMRTGREGDLRGLWNELFRKYFDEDIETVGITESLAPYFFFKADQSIPGGGSHKPVVGVDIGGGTSDVVVYQSNKPILLTSFKFAANAVFGDGFSEYGTKSNGFINKYYSVFESLLEKNKLRDLSQVLSSINENGKSEDINAFFFSIEESPKITEKHSFSYNSILSGDEDLKIIFVYFYASIVYHIAQLMKTQEIVMPKGLVFSGTGSKILSILSQDVRVLETFTQKIFEGVYGREIDEKRLFIVTRRDTPKEVTCKGGLMCNADELQSIDTGGIKSILNCTESVKDKKLQYFDLTTESVKNEIVDQIKDFNKFFLNLDGQYGFTEHFNVSKRSLKKFKEEFSEHLRDYLEEGLEFSKKLDDVEEDTEEVGETLFFYPIIGTINRIAGILAES